jgi:uncharacterized membrane protein
MALRFLVYGACGWCLEVVFTGLRAVLLDRDRSATAKTYLWMHPIYGGTALLLETLHDHLGEASFLAWLLLGVLVVYVAEYTSGLLLRRILGACPWDYGKSGFSVSGLVRLDYAWAWLLAVLLFGPLSSILRRLPL